MNEFETTRIKNIVIKNNDILLYLVLINKC